MDIKKYKIPDTPGSYQFYDKSGKIIYIGKAVNLRSRVFSYWRESANHSPAKAAMMKEVCDVKWIETDSEIEALLLESNLVKKYQPIFNIDLRDDKRFSYIKISTEDEIPGVFITRKLDKQGKYFGPFTSAAAVKETVKALRKIWPYCTERKLKNKACFYAQIGRCCGVCGGDFAVKEYKEKIIKPIVLFLSGEKKKVIGKLEVRSEKLEVGRKKLEVRSKKLDVRSKKLEVRSKKCLDVEDLTLLELEKELRFLKYQVLNMKNVLAHTRVLGVAEKYAADVVELAKILNLPKVPKRIEGYDISNIFGKEAVGSMVVFSGGEADKSQYRKFKIRASADMGDTGMLREIFERRLEHLNVKFEISNVKKNLNSKSKVQKSFIWMQPDLIIIDGGKGQLNVVVNLLKKNNLDIPVIAVSKGLGLRSAAAPDRIFFPGEGKPLELPLSSPALHIIKRVRDEAHRFAITYHRKLRGRVS